MLNIIRLIIKNHHSLKLNILLLCQQQINDRGLSNNSEGLIITHHQSYPSNRINHSSIYSKINNKKRSYNHVTKITETTITTTYKKQQQHHPPPH